MGVPVELELAARLLDDVAGHLRVDEADLRLARGDCKVGGRLGLEREHRDLALLRLPLGVGQLGRACLNSHRVIAQ